MPKKIGTGIKVSFPKIQVREYEDYCISLNCGKPRKTPRIMPSPFDKHDPRFPRYHKRIPKRGSL